MRFSQYPGVSRETVDLKTFVEHRLNGDDYGIGAVEAATASANNNREAFARLLECMVNKGNFTKNDIYQIVAGFVPNEVP